MRDPQRIDALLAIVRSVWTMYPDLRLGQLLVNATPAHQDVYYIEDIELGAALGELSLMPGDGATPTPGSRIVYDESTVHIGPGEFRTTLMQPIALNHQQAQAFGITLIGAGVPPTTRHRHVWITSESGAKECACGASRRPLILDVSRETFDAESSTKALGD